MVVGDSMSHGTEGDYTWRYRLWQWLKHAVGQHAVSFVGPFVGTVPPEQPHPPVPPRLPGEEEPPSPSITSGGYAKAVEADFDTFHFAHTGRQVRQAKDTIHEQVTHDQPDMLLVMLGFNDMGWCVSGPDETLADMKSFVDNARAAKPSLSFVLANVPQRTPGAHENLPTWTADYNASLRRAVVEWTHEASRVELADIESNYGYTPDGALGTFDGLHPNELGEYQIARAFSATLHQAFGLGNVPLDVPSEIPARDIHVPQNVKVSGVPYGIRCTFDAVYGTRGYDVRSRIEGQEAWGESQTGTNQVDNTFTAAGVKWQYQIRARASEQEKSAWSEIATGRAERSTAPAPSNVHVRATAMGFEVSWDPLDASYNVDRYAVLYIDKAGGFPSARATRGTHLGVDDLQTGHEFNVWTQTWTEAGPGVPSGAGSVLVGS